MAATNAYLWTIILEYKARQSTVLGCWNPHFWRHFCAALVATYTQPAAAQATTMFASPFDEALSKPMLEKQQQQKKFSWTSTVATVFTIDDDDSSQESYEAPTDILLQTWHDQELEVEELHGDHNEKAPLVTIDLEQAVLHERHKDIKNITSNMKLVNEIHQDLADVVESQDTDIKRMSWLAIEAFDDTENAVEQLQRASSSFMSTWIMDRQRRSRRGMLSVLLGLILLGAFAIKKMNEDPKDFNGDPQKFP